MQKLIHIITSQVYAINTAKLKCNEGIQEELATLANQTKVCEKLFAKIITNISPVDI